MLKAVILECSNYSYDRRYFSCTPSSLPAKNFHFLLSNVYQIYKAGTKYYVVAIVSEAGIYAPYSVTEIPKDAEKISMLTEARYVCSVCGGPVIIDADDWMCKNGHTEGYDEKQVPIWKEKQLPNGVEIVKYEDRKIRAPIYENIKEFIKQVQEDLGITAIDFAMPRHVHILTTEKKLQYYSNEVVIGVAYPDDSNWDYVDFPHDLGYYAVIFVRPYVDSQTPDIVMLKIRDITSEDIAKLPDGEILYLAKFSTGKDLLKAGAKERIVKLALQHPDAALDIYRRYPEDYPELKEIAEKEQKRQEEEAKRKEEEWKRKEEEWKKHLEELKKKEQDELKALLSGNLSGLKLPDWAEGIVISKNKVYPIAKSKFNNGYYYSEDWKTLKTFAYIKAETLAVVTKNGKKYSNVKTSTSGKYISLHVK